MDLRARSQSRRDKSSGDRGRPRDEIRDRSRSRDRSPSDRIRDRSPSDSLDSFINNNINTIRDNVGPDWNIQKITWWLKFESCIQIPPLFQSADVRTTARRIQAIVGKEPTREWDGDIDVLDHAEFAFLLTEGYHQPTGKPASVASYTVPPSRQIAHKPASITHNPWEDPELDKVLRSSIPDRRWTIPIQWSAAHAIPYVFNSIFARKSTAVYHEIAALYADGHPGVPPARPIHHRDELDFDHGDIAFYKNPIDDIYIKHSNVLELSKAIYHANPEIDVRTKAYLNGPETKSQFMAPSSNRVSFAHSTWFVRGQEAAIALLARLYYAHLIA